MLTEENLIQQAQKGDKNAFEGLVKSYQNRIYSLCYRYSGNNEDALDLAQEVFIKVYRNIASFEGRSSFSTWIYQIGSNTCKDFLRKKQNYQEFSLDEEIINDREEKFTPQVLRDEETPDLRYEEKEKIHFLQEALNKLKPEYKMLLLMREFEDLSYEEIAEESGLAVGTVKSRLSRGRKMLKDLYLEEMEGSKFEKE